VSTGPFLLLPPSEAKAFGGDRRSPDGTFDASLARARKEIRGALRTLLSSASEGRLERTFNVRGELLERAVAATSAHLRGRADLMPAWQRYVGVVWGHVDPSTLAEDQLERVLVPSGVYGVTTANDPIGDYRLKMNVTLAPLGQVARFWRPHLGSVLAHHLGGRAVVNLLPKEHEAAIDLDVLRRGGEVYCVVFHDAAGSRAVGHEAKAVKGVLARRLLEGGVGVFDGFEWEGWVGERRDRLVHVTWRR